MLLNHIRPDDAQPCTNRRCFFSSPPVWYAVLSPLITTNSMFGSIPIHHRASEVSPSPPQNTTRLSAPHNRQRLSPQTPRATRHDLTKTPDRYPGARCGNPD